MPQEKNKSQQNLIDEINESSISPVNSYQLVAYLESIGITDKMARQKYNFNDIFDLAEHILPYIKIKSDDSIKPEQKNKWYQELIFFGKYYLAGSVYSLPFIITICLLLIFRFSLWSSMDLTGGQSSSLYLATVFSLIISGGISQGIARKSISYISYLQYDMSKKISMFLTKIAVMLVFLVGLMLILANWFFSLLPENLFCYFLPFFILLSIMWILANLLYVLKRGVLYSVSLLLGVLVVGVLVKVGGMSLFPAQLLGLLVTNLLIWVAILQGFWKKSRPSPEHVLNMPRPSSLFASIRCYSLYGWSYFLFLFIDRFNGWTVSGQNIPYVFWYRGEYELGMNIAVLVIVFSSGFIEYTVAAFFEKLKVALAARVEDSIGYVKDTIQGFYKSRLLLFLVFILMSSILVTLLFFYLRGFIFNGTKYQIDMSTTTFVFFTGLVSYAFLLIGLFNTILVFSMSRPEFANHAILTGLAVNFIVGYLVSRIFFYSLAVLGLGVGAFVFMYISFKNIRRLLKDIDLYFYSSYLG